jgi:hypothetical protein
MSDQDHHFYAYELYQANDMPLSAAPLDRAWMDAADQRAPYRCLPLTIANQAGWFVPCPASFTATWDGGPTKGNVRIVFDPPANAGESGGLFAPIVVSMYVSIPETVGDARIMSHFGSGVITFSIPYLFRTPRGINLWVKGPTNWIKDGVQPLEGIVETDWLPATFTMNWKLTRPNYPVRFERGEPICMLVPIPRGLAENLEPLYAPLDTNPKLAREFHEWEQSRANFNADLASGRAEAVRRGWQRDYTHGKTVSGEQAEEHQTRLRLRDFSHAEKQPVPPKGD